MLLRTQCKLKSGGKLKFALPTLYHKWRNADDNIGLLNFGGTTFEKPALTSQQDPRTVAISTLDAIREAMNMHVGDFKKVALFFANCDFHGDGKSLSRRYFKNHFKTEQQIEGRFTELLAK